jgi:hypothetical protein
VLCAATVALWIHSEFHSAILEHIAPRDGGGFIRRWEIDSRAGSITTPSVPTEATAAY